MHDILILGAGPAGLSTALHIARNHPSLIPRLLILEKAHHPRPKLCAGGLVIDAETILQRLGLDVSEIPHVDPASVNFNYAGRGLRVHAKGRHTLRIIRRDEFDSWLVGKARQAGVEIREGITVLAVRPEAEQVTVETSAGTFHAQAVVGADGSNGVTRRSIFPGETLHRARLLEVLTPGYPVLARERNDRSDSPVNEQIAPGKNIPRTDNAAVFDFLCIPAGIQGYTWDFPTQLHGTPMRCWGVYDTNLYPQPGKPPLRQVLGDEMLRYGFNLEEYELKGHPIHWFDPAAGVSAPRVLLAGDAAGADSLLGEGISIALGYGALAAREIHEALELGDFSFRHYKRRFALSGLGRALMARWVLAQILYSFQWRWFQFLVWRLLNPLVILLAWLFILNWAGREKNINP